MVLFVAVRPLFTLQSRKGIETSFWFRINFALNDYGTIQTRQRSKLKWLKGKKQISYLDILHYINYVRMEGFCWTIKLPDPTHYGQTFDLKPEQKAKASFKA